MLLTIMCMPHWHKSNRVDQISVLSFSRIFGLSWALSTNQPPYPYIYSTLVAASLCGMHYLFITQPITFRLCFSCSSFNPLIYFSVHSFCTPWCAMPSTFSVKVDVKRNALTRCWKGYGEYLIDFFSSFILKIKSILLSWIQFRDRI